MGLAYNFITQREEMTIVVKLANKGRPRALNLKQWSRNQERARTVFRVDSCKNRQDINKGIDSGYSGYSLITTKGRRTDMKNNVKLFWTNWVLGTDGKSI